MKSIDLRSDTVTHPSPAMLEAMCHAPLGDDTLGDDPTVHELEERIAEMTGMEAALFVPSGTMANLLALRSQTEPGDEIIAHKGSHILHYEAGGYAAICGCSIQTLDTPRGIFAPDDARPLIRHDAPHYPRTRLVEIQHTTTPGGGAACPPKVWRSGAPAPGPAGTTRAPHGTPTPCPSSRQPPPRAVALGPMPTSATPSKH